MMVEVLSAVFVIAFLFLLAAVSGCATLLCLLAGKSRSAAGWFTAGLASAGALVAILGGL